MAMPEAWAPDNVFAQVSSAQLLRGSCSRSPTLAIRSACSCMHRHQQHEWRPDAVQHVLAKRWVFSWQAIFMTYGRMEPRTADRVAEMLAFDPKLVLPQLQAELRAQQAADAASPS